MSPPQRHLHSGPSSNTTQPSQTTTGTRLEVSGTLRLRGNPAADRRIRWAEDVVDNEGMGRKKSKVCCIYHPPRAVGESSSESSSDSSSSDGDSGSERDNSTARISGKGKKMRQHIHQHDHDHDSEDRDDREGCSKEAEGVEVRAKGKGKGSRRKRSPNAYEKMPKSSKTQTVVMKP